MPYAATHDELDREVDLAVAGSFPASDPPPWTLGAPHEEWPSPSLPRTAVAPAAIDVVIAAGDRRRFAGLLELLAMIALVPIGVLLIAAPLLLVLWGIGALVAMLGGR